MYRVDVANNALSVHGLAAPWLPDGFLVRRHSYSVDESIATPFMPRLGICSLIG